MLLVVIVGASTGIAKILREALTNPAVWITGLTALVIPLLNAVLTKVETHPGFKAALAAALAGVFALVAWLTSLGNVVVDWKQALGVFFIALIGAGGLGKSVLAGPLVDWIHRLTDPDPMTGKKGVGIGPVTSPAKAFALHDNHGGAPMVPVPPDAGVVPPPSNELKEGPMP